MGKSYGQSFTFKKKKTIGFQKGKKPNQKAILKKWQLVDIEIADLAKRLSDGIDSSEIKKFTDFPLSRKTLDGLKEAKYEVPTEIQKESICLALQGKDILGAAKTGSGKTLAFLIPVLESLFKLKWSHMDGMGALIISPTRELAYQTFEVLKKVGRFHDFSAGLVIGGKFLREEIAQINKTNIVICTPGRLLQHLDETYNFNADGLQILVLDEADRILDMGFAKTMNAIISNLPSKRQTLLFSATQTKSVKDLARLSLKEPMYVSVHEHSAHSTPARLEQSYIVCELHEKLSMLWSFLKNHLHSKILVFLTCCKQVKYVYEVMRHLQPGMTVICLHGAMNQLKRVAIYEEFCRKQHVVLFATDIAARGLVHILWVGPQLYCDKQYKAFRLCIHNAKDPAHIDFPAVNWVVQLDCPEDASTYIHRAGRTARFEHDGEALLVLMPSEEEYMVKQLNERKIPINKIRVNQKRLIDISPKLQAMCAADTFMKGMAQRAFVSYLRSIFLMKNKQVFDVRKLNTDAFSVSLGLAIPPKIRFMKRENKQIATAKSSRASTSETKVARQNSSDSDEEETEDEKGEELEESDVEDESEGADDSDEVQNREVDKNFGADLKDESEEDGELFTVKRKLEPLHSDQLQDIAADEMDKINRKRTLTKAAIAKRILKKNIMPNMRVTFDDEGNALYDAHKRQLATDEDANDNDSSGINVEAAAKRMRLEDERDKELYRQKIKQKHKEERLKRKEMKRAEKGQTRVADEDEPEAVLATDDDGADPLSFIPDPDKLATRLSDDSDDERDYDIASASDSDENSIDEEESLSSGEQSNSSDDMESHKNVIDDEELALHLLTSSKNKR